MSPKTRMVGKQLLSASLIGAFGGMAPKLLELLTKLQNNGQISWGYVIALIILGAMGAIIVIVFKEKDLKRALVLGAGAPAIVGTLIAQTANINPNGIILPVSVSIFPRAYAQEPAQADTVKFVITMNESRFRLNELWIRADSKTISEYKQFGDTITVFIPKDSKELLLDLPTEGSGLVLTRTAVVGKQQFVLRIIKDQNKHDFWQTIGNANVPLYKIEKAE